jgi:hypothetical protein
MSQTIDDVYAERDRLILFLTRIFPSYLALDPNPEEGWSYLVFLETPKGQLSWHVPDREALTIFSHLPIEDNRYDGHSTIEKYLRLDALRRVDILKNFEYTTSSGR